MNQVNIESGTSQPKGTEVRTEEFNGFTISNKTTVEDLLNSIRELAQRNYDAGYKAGQREGYKAGNLTRIHFSHPLNQEQNIYLLAGHYNILATHLGTAKVNLDKLVGQYQVSLYTNGNYCHSWFVDKIEKGNDYVPVPRS